MCIRDSLEPGLLPAGVGVGGPLHAAVLDLALQLAGEDGKGEVDLEQLLVFLPVDGGLKVDAGAVAVEDDLLLDGGVQVPQPGAHHPAPVSYTHLPGAAGSGYTKTSRTLRPPAG